MVSCDALIVGGGPAGSTCARALRLAGWDVIVMDRARFPRDKVCAGWLTPAVFDLLQLDPCEVRDAGLVLQPIRGFVTGLFAAQATPPRRGYRTVRTRYPRVVSYAIRRIEFDDFLLRRAGVRVLEHTALTTLERAGETWLANGHLRARVVIGAGGHFCPVARHLRGTTAAPAPVVAKEAEYRLDADSSSTAAEEPELFFCRDLEGYGWCVRKGRYLNVGIGRRDKHDFGRYVEAFAQFLERTGKAPGARRARWRGHAYFASGVGDRPVIGDGMALVGDAAGLAYPESGEGIKPAIESAVLAAETLIATNGRCRREDLRPYEAALRRRHPATAARRSYLSAPAAAAGRLLLRSPAFTRRVVLDRWFLRLAGSR
jgi:geranylgeranyl reductase family protein